MKPTIQAARGQGSGESFAKKESGISADLHEESARAQKDASSSTGAKAQGDEAKAADENHRAEDAPEDKRNGEERKPGGFHLSFKTVLIGSLVLVALLAAGILYWLQARQFVSTDDAYTAGHVHQISARLAGTVNEVRVDDNQAVHADDVLVRLDPRDQQVALQKARAGLEQARGQAQQADAKIGQSRAQLEAAKAQVSQAEAQVLQAAAQLEKAQSDYNRAAGLYSKDIKAVSKADVEAAKEALDRAQSSVAGARASLAAEEAQVGAASANVQSAEADAQVSRANIITAEAQVKDAELQLSYCEIRAPVAGKVSKKTVETGQRLQPGQALMAIVPQKIWILANFKETQLDRLQAGQRVDIKIDTLPGRTFAGTVDSIQEGSGATFSLLPQDNATGNFTKIVQRVPVKIVFDEESIRDFQDKIVPGLSVEPKIDLESRTDHRREEKREKRVEKQNREIKSGR